MKNFKLRANKQKMNLLNNGLKQHLFIVLCCMLLSFNQLTAQTIYEAENFSSQDGSCTIKTGNSSTGSYVDYGNWIELNNVNPGAGDYQCIVNYALGSGERPLEITLNGAVVDTFDCPATGSWQTWSTDTISLTLTEGDNSIRLSKLPDSQGPNVDFIQLDLQSNQAPVMQTPADQQAEIGTGEQSIVITGIDDGDVNSEQSLSLTAATIPSSTSIISGLSVGSISGSETTLNYTPNETGIVEIELTLRDNGGTENGGIDTYTTSFQITVINPDANKAPTIDPLDDLKILSSEIGNPVTVALTGISDGDESVTQSISINATSSEPTVVATPVGVSYSSGDALGSLEFTPLKIGSTNITVTVTDDGGTADGGFDTKTITFQVNVLDLGNFGLIEDFNDNNTIGWSSAAPLNLSASNQELNITGRKMQIWDAVNFNFSAIDIRDYPRVSFKAKTDKDIIITVAAFESNESGNRAYYLKTPTELGFQAGSREVIDGAGYQSFSFDLRSVPDSVLEDLSQLMVMINFYALTDELDVQIDDFKVGIAAEVTPDITDVPDQVFTVQQSGTQARTLKLRGITDGMNHVGPVSIMAESSNTSLLPHPIIDYTSYERTGKITIQPNDNIVGDAVVTVTVTSPEMPNPKVMKFNVNVSPNNAPGIKPVDDITVEKTVQREIHLKGLHDGNPETEQNLTVSANSADESKLLIDDIDYDAFSQSAILKLTATSDAVNEDVVTVSITVEDDGNLLFGGDNDSTITFDVTIYDELNNEPYFKGLNKMTFYDTESGIHQFVIEGITDGDDVTQKMGFEITSSDPAVAGNFVIGEITPEGTDTVQFETFENTGIATITITLTDSAGTATNNGNQSFTQEFDVEVLPLPMYGYKNNFDGTNGSVITVGGTTASTTMTAVEENDNLHVTLDKIPKNWPSVLLDIYAETGEELDMTKNQIMNIRIKSSSANNNGIADNTLMGIYLVDNRGIGEKPTAWPASLHEFFNPEDDEYHYYVVDFSNGPFEKEEVAIDLTRIQSVLLTFDQYWFEGVEGEYWVDYLAIGDSAYAPPAMTIDDVANQTLLPGEEPAPVQLTGITDGQGNKTAKLTVQIGNPALVSNFDITPVDNGQSTFTYTLAPNVIDTSSITIIANNPNVDDEIMDTLVFIVSVADTLSASMVDVAIDLNEEHQTMVGIGPHCRIVSPDVAVDIYKEMNFTLSRLFGWFDGVESTNDNGDPDVLELNKFKMSETQMELLRRLNAETNCQTWHYCPLSQPVWMKFNKQPFTIDPWFKWTMNNRLNPDYYDELGEWFAGIVKAVKSETGVDLYAVSISNEPQFDEPYSSTEIPHDQFGEIITAMGQRFDAEGIDIKIVAPDNPNNFDWVSGPVNDINSDPESAPHLGIIGFHGTYLNDDATGETLPTNESLQQIKNLVEGSNAEGAWHTEGHAYSDTWFGEYAVGWNGTYHFMQGINNSIVQQLYMALSVANVSGYEELGTDQLFTEGRKNYPNRMAMFKQYTHYILPGDKRVTATSADPKLLPLAFKDADGAVKMVLANMDRYKSRVVRLSGNGFLKKFTGHLTEQHNLFTSITQNDSIIVMPPMSVISLKAVGNATPTINKIADVTHILTDGDFTVNLSGITDGDSDKEQNLTVTANSSDASVATVNLSYTPNNETGTLEITPSDDGETTISVTVQDDGGNESGAIDSKTITFKVSIFESVNNKPTIDEVSDVEILEDADEYTINLTGITDGDEGGIDQGISLALSNSNQALTGAITATEVQSGGTATLTFTPAADANGTATINLTVTDQGGTADNNGDMSIVESFDILVQAVNDEPTVGTVANIDLDSYSATYPVTVKGIDDGDPEDQVINVDASSSDQNFVTVSVDYPNGDDATQAVVTLNFPEAENGNATITVTVSDDGGTASGGVDQVSTTFDVSLTQTGIPSITGKDVKIYPNPAREVLYLEFNKSRPEMLMITDMVGKPVIIRKTTDISGNMELDMRQLRAGVYIISLKYESTTLKKRLIIE